MLCHIHHIALAQLGIFVKMFHYACYTAMAQCVIFLLIYSHKDSAVKSGMILYGQRNQGVLKTLPVQMHCFCVISSFELITTELFLPNISKIGIFTFKHHIQLSPHRYSMPAPNLLSELHIVCNYI